MKTLGGPPARTHTMYMMHNMFRREFWLMPDLIHGVADGDKERAQIVARHINLVDLMLHHHHHTEDTHLWPKLLARGAEDVASIVPVMETQHENIERIVGEIKDAVATWRDTPQNGQRFVLLRAVNQLVPTLTEHMDMEESRALELIERHVTADEWELMARDAVSTIPPEDLPVLLGMALYEGDPEDVQEVLSQLPPDARVAMKKLAEDAYAAHAEGVYGTATPPRIKGVPS